MKKQIIILILILGFCGTSFAQYIAIDPTRQIPNGRVLALGKAYIGLADDTGSIFTNPAGLADSENWQLTSMSGKFLEEYQFLSFAGFYPTNYGVVGVGYAGTTIGGAYATTMEAGTESDPVYVFDFSQPPMENNNSAIVLSYANELKKINLINRLPFADRFSFGTSLKLFSTSITGDGIQAGQGIGSGYELDLGAKFYPPAKWMKFGVTMQNLLPGSLGGKLTYTSGHTESYPALLEVGSVFQVLGQENALREYGRHDVKVMLDFDMHPTLANYPLCWHVAAEYKPLPIVAVRVALDQDAGDDGTGNIGSYTDLAYGVGLNVGGLSFDYAYHTFAGAPNIDNHYFSLSYGLETKKVEDKKPIVLEKEIDKLLTFDETISIVGEVVDRNIQVLIINGVPIKFGLQGEFKTEVSLEEGQNAIPLQAKDKADKLVVDAKIRVLRLKVFPDVDQKYWAAQPISLLAMQKIVSGYPGGRFKPKGGINRAEICALLMKAKGSKPEKGGVKTTFKDVKKKHWASPYIAEAAKLGIVKGYPDGSFKPKKKITRAEGLTMIARFAGIEKQVYAGQFSDVKSKFWGAQIISGAYKAGILKYLEGKRFQTKRELTRAETVEMLYRTQYVKDLLAKDLLNWESY